jgi:mannose-6-phosphate isomerase class I
MARRKLRRRERFYNQQITTAEQWGAFDLADTPGMDRDMETAELWDVCHRSDTAKLLERAVRPGISLEKMCQSPEASIHTGTRTQGG